VHDHIRHDPSVCAHPAARVADGAEPDDVQAAIASLKTNSPLWKLRVNCLYYCRFVHAHHNIEDIALFPALPTSNFELGHVVDTLEADDRTVSDRLEVEAAAEPLVDDDAPAARARVVRPLNDSARICSRT
jgi:hypothetical protein